jgi:hypothetical protein
MDQSTQVLSDRNGFEMLEPTLSKMDFGNKCFIKVSNTFTNARASRLFGLDLPPNAYWNQGTFLLLQMQNEECPLFLRAGISDGALEKKTEGE